LNGYLKNTFFIRDSLSVSVTVFNKRPLKAKKEISMNSSKDKLKGSVNSTIGSLKEGTGRVTGNTNLEAEGSIQKAKGKVQKLSGAVKDTLNKGKNLLGIK